LEETYKLSSQDECIINLDPDQALEEIMGLYGHEIKRLIFTYVKNQADTDDVSQEVFVTVYKKLHTFKGNSSLKSWLYAIAINKSKDYLRSWNLRNLNLRKRLTESFMRKSLKEESSEELLLKDKESKALIQTIMELPLKYREVIILYYFKDLSTKEIAEILQVKDPTVRTRLRRARSRLKETIRKEGGDLFGL